MSQKIPFLQMFAALRRWTELAQAAEGWLIVSASIDRAARTASIAVEGAAGAGPNLIREVEEALCRAYGLRAAKLQSVPAEKAERAAESEPAPSPEPEPAGEGDPFAREDLSATRRINLDELKFGRNYIGGED